MCCQTASSDPDSAVTPFNTAFGINSNANTLPKHSFGRGKLLYDIRCNNRGITATVLALKKRSGQLYHPRASGSNTPDGRADLGNVFCLPGPGERWWGLSQEEQMNGSCQQSCTASRSHISQQSSPRQLWPVLQHFLGEKKSHWTWGVLITLWRWHRGNEQQQCRNQTWCWRES